MLLHGRAVRHAARQLPAALSVCGLRVEPDGPPLPPLRRGVGGAVVFELARRLDPGLPLDWRLLLSGYSAQYAYDQHALLPGHTFDQLRRAGHVTARARAAGDAADFSRRIRAGMPDELPEPPHER